MRKGRPEVVLEVSPFEHSVFLFLLLSDTGNQMLLQAELIEVLERQGCLQLVCHPPLAPWCLVSALAMLWKIASTLDSFYICS